MGAGLAVVTALVGGNAAYITPDHNALVVPYEDVDAHLAAIEQIIADDTLRSALTQAGHQTVGSHTLQRERNEFHAVLRAIAS